MKDLIKFADKNAGFEGQGISIGGSTDNKTSAASSQEINNLQAAIPSEPAEGAPGSYTIVFKNSENSFQRRFNAADTINNLKDFVKLQMKTNSNVQLFENLPRKVYSNDSVTLDKSGLSTYQMLFFSFN